MNIPTLAQEIDAGLRALPKLDTSHVRALRQAFSARLARESAESILALADYLLDFPLWEHRLVAYELIYHHRAARQRLDEAWVLRLGRRLDAWYAVDTYAAYIVGPAWRAGQLSDTQVWQWADSADRWQRRLALVATTELNKKSHGGRGDVPRTLTVCAQLVGDGDDMVVKGLSWALRELATREPDAVRDFLAAHGDRLAARARREVRHKLETGLKNPRRGSAATHSG